MIRRITALALWAYFAWYLAAMLATAVDASPLAGPTAAALTIAMGVFGWARTHGSARTSHQPAESQPSR